MSTVTKYTAPNGLNVFVFNENFLLNEDTGQYKYKAGDNIQDQNDDRYEEFDALVESGDIVVTEHTSTSTYTDALDYTAAMEEREWRNEQLLVADVEIRKLTDSSGDASAWRLYRQALRDWPADPNFPQEAHRPVAP